MNKRSLEIDEFVDRLNKSAAPIVQKLSEALQQLAQAIAPHVELVVRYSKFIDSVSATGWLPYHSVPIQFVEESDGNTPLLERRLSAFYEANWDYIRQDIESRLETYRVSEEARATFREALSAHEMGHYRCVCRVLFPEIDRAFRTHFFDDQAGSISSRKMIEKLTNHGSLEDFMPREVYGWILFGRLVEHLYETVDDGNRKMFERDFVPNRHASLHGLVPYSTHKHSVNMVIMADYIFQILTSTSISPSPPR